MHDEASLLLHKHPLVLVSLVVSCFAIMISLFNFVMFKINDFDPIIIEQELFMRRQRLEAEKDQAREIDDPRIRFLERRSSFKR